MNNNYMRSGKRLKGLQVAVLLSLSLLLLSFSGYSQSFSIKVLSELTVPNAEFDEGATEIPAYFPGVDSVFITDGQNGIVRIINITDPANPAFVDSIDFTTDVSNDQGVDASALGINSVAFNGSLVALAVEYENTMMVDGQEVEFQDNGFVALYDSSGTFTTSVTVGSLPDMLAFTSSGDTIVVANEGEPSEDYSVDPEGSVSIVDVTDPSNPVVADADFSSFHKATLNAAGVRIFGPNATAAEDLEPEYVTIRNDTAFVSCQENNALAIVELSSATVLDVVPLGFKDHSAGGNPLDASNRDDQINIQNWPVFGMYQPDAIESFEIGGETYLVTANEGDARDYNGFSEEFRMGDLLLETGKFAADIQEDDQLGRLRTTSTLGLSNKEFIVQAPLTGDQEVPEVTTNASGMGEVRLIDGTATFRLTVQGIDFSNVDAAAPVGQDIKDATATTDTLDDFTRLHIHAGSPSENDSVIHFFYDEVIDPVITDGGDSIASISYSLNPDDNSVIIEGEFIGLDDDFLAAAKDAQFLDTINYYFNLHTKGNPGGEIRGNLNRGKALYSDEDEDRGFAIFDTLYSYGARSFSLWKVGPSGPERVYDSGDDFEQITAQRFPAFFNSTNDENAFDNRSDDKGPEPEGVTVGKIGSETYAFIGMERIGGIMVYNITDPMNPHFENYVNNRDFSVVFDTDDEGDPDPTEAQLRAAKDLGPEGLVFIPADESPNGTDLLAVTNEITGTFTIYELDNAADYTLTILHNNDGESNLLAGDDQPGGISRFKTVVDSVRNEQASLGNGLVMLSSGDNILPGRQLDAGLRRTDGPIYDAFALDEIGYDALAIGNHEFDFGVDTLARFISDFRKTMPTFLSANLDFSGEQVLQDLVDAGRIAPSTIIETAGDSVGVIGLTTDALRSISSPEGVIPSSMLAESVNEEVTNLTDQGINKIILISHLQNISNDTMLIKKLSGVDIVIAGGGDELLSNEGNPVLPGDEEDISGSYPLEVLDSDSEKVYVITSKGSYQYLGRLTATFDENGVVTSIEGNPVAITSDIARDSKLKAEVEDPIAQFLLEQNNNVVATTGVTLTGTRSEVRTRETNLGNLITDAILFQANRLADNANVEPADIAIQNGGGIRNSVVIEPGNITEGNTIDALPFANFVSIVEEVPADTLKLILERAASGLPDAEGRFVQVSGFRVEIDTTRAALGFTTDDAGNVTGINVEGERVRKVVLDDGTVVIDNGEVKEGVGPFNIATNSFSAARGDQLQFPERVVQLPSSYQQALFDYLTLGEDIGALDSVVTAEKYPEGGEGRITQIGDDLRLTIFHNNDGESNLAVDDNEPGGIDKFATVIDSARAAARVAGTASILLSSGDNILPGRQLEAGLRRENGPIYDAFALDKIGYDALTIGNHEFDFGPDTLSRFIRDFEQTMPPFLSANLDFSAESSLQELVDNGRIAPSAILEVNSDSVGVIGLTTPALRSISSPGGVVPSESLVDSVNAQVAKLKDAGINKIILISHLQSVTEDTTLVKMLTDIDVVIAGGGDELLANPGDTLLAGDDEDVEGAYPLLVPDMNQDTVLVVTTKGAYEYLGALTVTFNDDGKVTNYGGAPIPVFPEVERNALLRDSVVTPIQAFLQDQDNNVIGTTEDTLRGNRPLVRSQETNFGNLISDALLFQANRLAAGANVDTATIALQNGGGIRNSVVIEPGNITEGNTFDALPFSNFVSIVEAVPADTLKLLMENAVSGLPDVEGRFTQVSGFTVVVDTSRNPLVLETNDAGDVTGIAQPGERIASLILDDGTVVVEGGEVQDVGPFNIATNSFSAAGGDNYPFPERVVQLPSSYQRALFDYITTEEGLDSLVTQEQYPDGGEGRITFDALPVAENVTVTGEFKVGEELTGSYSYSDADGDEEAGTTFAWVRADDADGTNATPIDGANAATYTLTAADEGSFIAFQVLPRAATGVAVGVKTNSAFGGAVAPNEAPVAENVTLSIEGDGTLTTPLTGDILAVAYQYNDEEGDPEGETRIQWLADNTPISGATEASYTLTENEVGSTISAAITPVAQTGTLEGNAAFSDETGAVEEGPNSVDELLKSIGVSVYPNPVTENLSFDIIGRKSGNYTFRLYDALGKLYIERRVTRATSIKLGNLQPGTYFMQVIDGRTETNVRTKLLVK